MFCIFNCSLYSVSFFVASVLYLSVTDIFLCDLYSVSFFVASVLYLIYSKCSVSLFVTGIQYVSLWLIFALVSHGSLVCFLCNIFNTFNTCLAILCSRPELSSSDRPVWGLSGNCSKSLIFHFFWQQFCVKIEVTRILGTIETANSGS